MRFYTDNPQRDADNYDRWKEKQLLKFPLCDICGNHIMDKFYEIDCEAVCPKCLEKHYARRVEE